MHSQFPSLHKQMAAPAAPVAKSTPKTKKTTTPVTKKETKKVVRAEVVEAPMPEAEPEAPASSWLGSFWSKK